MRIPFVISIACFLLSMSTYCAVIPKDYPQDLIYKSAVIDPLCFDQNESPENVSLDKCGIQSISDQKISGYNKNLIKKGYIGFDFKNDDFGGNGYSYYKIIGLFKQYYIIYTVNSGGGSGEFTSVYLVKRENNRLKLKPFASGDRCNGGVSDVKQKQNKLTFSVNMTPFDFIDVTKQNPHHLRAYDDLDACAACCVATAIYENNLNDKSVDVKPVLIAVRLNSDLDSVGSNGNNKNQICFNHLVLSYVNKVKMSLTPVELMQFVNLFNQVCFKK